MSEVKTHNSGIDTRRGRLPESYDVHWSDARKADVVRAVRDRLISFDEARWRYLLSRQEFKGWQKELTQKGQKDLTFDLAEVE
ncbi:DUF1153 domain-containing protein [Altererythrobacter sp. CAU 1778]